MSVESLESLYDILVKNLKQKKKEKKLLNHRWWGCSVILEFCDIQNLKAINYLFISE